MACSGSAAKCCSMVCSTIFVAVLVAVVAGLFWPVEPWPASPGKFPTPSVDLGFHQRFISVEPGVHLFVLERPGLDESLPPIVFMHGIMDSWRSFEKLWPRLDRKRRVIAFDHRGHGNSSKPLSSPYTIPMFANDLQTLMDALQVERIGCLVGHSLGSMTAWHFAGTHPHRVERMMLIGTGEALSTANRIAFNVIAKVLSSNSQASSPHWFGVANAASMVTNVSDMGDWFFETCTYQTMLWAPCVLTQAAPSIVRQLEAERAEPLLKAITARTSFIEGADDTVFPPSSTKPMLHFLKPQCQATLKVVPGEGHAVHWTERGAEVVATGIIDLLTPQLSQLSLSVSAEHETGSLYSHASRTLRGLATLRAAAPSTLLLATATAAVYMSLAVASLVAMSVAAAVRNSRQTPREGQESALVPLLEALG